MSWSRGSHDATSIWVPCDSHLYIQQHGSILKLSIWPYYFQPLELYLARFSLIQDCALSQQTQEKSFLSFY